MDTHREMTRRVAALALLLVVVAGCVASPTPSAQTPAVTGAAGTPTPSPSPGSSPGASAAITDRYPDALPKAIDDTTVLRGSAALARAVAAADDSTFLIGGWVTYLPGPRFCTLKLAGDTSWLHDCVKAGFSDRAGGDDSALTAAITFRFVLAGLSTGPVVAEVEVHDPRAVTCGAAQAACDRLMVVQHLRWTGDAATDPRPLSALAVQGALRTVQPGAELVPHGPTSLISDCGESLAAARVYPVSTDSALVPAVTLVEIEPSPPARALALPVAPEAAASLTPAALVCTVFATTPKSSLATEYRWLAAENVVLLVRTHDGPTEADRAFMAQLITDLQRAATPG
jgi:hypothetical protein